MFSFVPRHRVDVNCVLVPSTSYDFRFRIGNFWVTTSTILLWAMQSCHTLFKEAIQSHPHRAR